MGWHPQRLWVPRRYLVPGARSGRCSEGWGRCDGGRTKHRSSEVGGCVQAVQEHDDSIDVGEPPLARFQHRQESLAQSRQERYVLLTEMATFSYELAEPAEVPLD